MSDTITEHFKAQYSDGIELLSQQMSEETRSAVTVMDMMGKKKSPVDQLGSFKLQRKQGRSTEIPIVSANHKRRWLTSIKEHGRDFIDESDILQTLVDPSNAYTDGFAAAAARTLDKTVIDGMLGTNYVGEEGTTAVQFPSSQVIGDGAAHLNFNLLKEGVRLLKSRHALRKGDTVYLGLNAYQEDKFINTTEVKSSDFTQKRVIDAGGVDEFYKVKFLYLEDLEENDLERMLPKSGTTRSLPLWVKRKVVLGIRQDAYGRVAWDSNRESWQVSGGIDCGATRTEEVGVVRIDVLEN